jgi:V-type H+-transporting ATPase subunit a
MLQVLNKTQDLMGGVVLPLEQRGVGIGGLEETSLLSEARQMDAVMRFTTTTGVVAASERERFERTLFRATRGNCYFQFMEIDQPLVDGKTGLMVAKVAFVILYKSSTIGVKISKICDAFGAFTYELPELSDKQAIDQLRARNASEIRDSSLVLAKNNEQRERMCTFLAQNVEEWKWAVVREKSIYHSLNLFKADVTGMLRAEGWVVEAKLNEVRGALNKSHENMGHGMLLEPMPPNSWPTPPTHYETNKFTAPYQVPPPSFMFCQY